MVKDWIDYLSTNDLKSNYTFGHLLFDLFNLVVYTLYEFYIVHFILYAVFAPLFSFIFVYFYGSKLGFRGSSFIVILNTMIALFIATLYLIFEYGKFGYLSVGYLKYASLTSLDFYIPTFISYNWFSFAHINISWGFMFDPVAVAMIWVVLFITLLVQLYCLDYMHGDPFFSKFYAYLSIFSFFMLFLVCSANYLQVFLGWEGVGLASFMLISFWNTRKAAIFAGMKAMFVNRVGDVFFLFSSLIMLKEFQSLDFLFLKRVIFDLNDYYQFSTELQFFSFSIIVAAMAKSAQLGLHIWLPDAMEGPTPVSALIHAATMVTAGIFVLIRSSFILVLFPSALACMSIIGGFTALFGSSVATVQYDIKKIVAYSTCSQLGYMMIGCGSGNFFGAFFHLVNHAFFKAMLFLGSGSVIHAMSNEQDIRKMGGLINFLPFTFSIMLFGSMALGGIPFFSGFYSKDNILELSYMYNSDASLIAFGLGICSIFFTAFYSFRLLYLVFFGYYRGPRVSVAKIHEPGFFMSISLLILVFPSVAFGYYFNELFIGDLSKYFWSFSMAQINFEYFVVSGFISKLPLVLNFLGIFFSYLVYTRELNLSYTILNSSFFQPLYLYLARKWFFDDFWTFITLKFVRLGNVEFWLYFERGFLYYFGPKGLSAIFKRISATFTKGIENIHFLYVKLIVVTLFSVFLWFMLGITLNALNAIFALCFLNFLILIYLVFINRLFLKTKSSIFMILRLIVVKDREIGLSPVT